MNKSFEVELFCYQDLFLSIKVVSLSFRTSSEGDLTILFDHAPLISDLQNSKLEFALADGQKKIFQINRGIFYFKNNQAKLMADKIEEVK